MDTALQIRPATEDDLPAITGIYGHHVLHGTASFEESAPSIDEMRERFGTLQRQKMPYLVAQLGSKIAGYAYAGAFRPRPAYRYSIEASVYIDKDCQGQGVGSALLAELIEICRSRGFHQMVSVITAENLPAINLHKKHGFKLSGVIDAVGYKHGRWLGTAIMQRTLVPYADGEHPTDF